MIDFQNARLRAPALALGLAVLLTACSGGGGGDSPAPAPAGVAVSGTLSAPGGSLAFNVPSRLERMFAAIFGGNAAAAIPGTTAVSGATVKLIEINAAGTQVGADIATATTAANGSFTLTAPAGFTPGAQYVIRASGTTTLERMLTDLTAQDVDPATTAVKTLVLAQLQGAGMAPRDLPRAQLEQLLEHVATQAADLDAASINTAAAFLAGMATQAQEDEEAGFALANLVATGSVTGTVTDSAGAPLANIKIVARDFNQWVTRAQTRTDANGQYTLRLIAGDYIVGALNFTGTSMGASEWWTCNDTAGGPTCGAANMFGAGKVTVAGGAVTGNFKLEPGARVQGTIVTSGTSTPLPGVDLAVRDFTTDQAAFFRRSFVDGSFRINLRPGTYTVAARNRTRLPFAGGLYNGPASGGTATNSGGASASAATPMQLVAGTTYPVNFQLSEGGVVRGVVTDGTNPVAGIAVRYYDTTSQIVEAQRTNKVGKYRLWLQPGTYEVRSRGQLATPTVVAFSANNNPAAVNFTAVVGHAHVIVRDAGGNPLPQVKVRVYETVTANRDLQGHENSNSDGSVDMYAPTGNFLVEYKVDNGSTGTGSAIHDGTATPTGKQLASGTVIPFDGVALAPNDLGTITLPAGGELKGTVTLGGNAVGGLVVQVRFGGTGGAARFVNTRTQSDGSYTVSLPAATYDRVCAFVPGTAGACGATLTSAGLYAGVNGVAVTAGASNTLNIAIP